MALDPIRNFAISRVATVPSPASSGTTLVVDTGDGALFPDPASSGAFNVVIYPNGEQPDSSNAEIVRVTARTTDTFTIVRQQEGTSARTITEGDVIMLGITRKVLEDIQNVAIGAVPTGLVSEYAGATAPTGYLMCDGAAVSRTTYSALFTAIGTAYGAGDGSTTFNVPNLKGRVPAGYDSSQTEFNALGKTGGAKTHTLTVAEMPAHSHDTVGYRETSGAGQLVFELAATSINPGYQTGTTGGGGAHNNLQPYTVLNYIIKT